MVSMTLPMELAAAPNWSMLVDALEALCAASSDIPLAFSAFWAISSMVEDISSEAVTTMLVLVADCSMAAATVFMLALISSAGDGYGVGLVGYGLVMPLGHLFGDRRQFG